jgi:hypothetical protein
MCVTIEQELRITPEEYGLGDNFDKKEQQLFVHGKFKKLGDALRRLFTNDPNCYDFLDVEPREELMRLISILER